MGRISTLLLALALSGVAGAQAPQFMVEVPALVLDGAGQPVLQLDQDQFRLLDNGRMQRVTRFEREARPVALALVVDTGDRDAVLQVQRSAELVTAMVMGAGGEASLYVSGPDPRRVLGPTRDHDAFAGALRHLRQTPQAPQGEGQITRPAGLALLDLAHQPDSESRAVVIIGREAGRHGAAAEALVRSALGEPIAVFRLSPHRPDGTAAAVNPDAPAVAGTGVGSQRDANVLPSAAMPGRQGAAPGSIASVDLTPVPRKAISLAGAVIEPHQLDYVYDSGGVTLEADDNADFDRKLSSIGADLRSFYWLYFRPDAPGRAGTRHELSLRVVNAGAKTLSYRRGYFAPAAAGQR